MNGLTFTTIGARAAAGIFCLAIPAKAQPLYVNITGVAQGDMLNIRSQSSALSSDIAHQSNDGRYRQPGCCHLPFDSGQQ